MNQNGNVLQLHQVSQSPVNCYRQAPRQNKGGEDGGQAPTNQGDPLKASATGETFSSLPQANSIRRDSQI